MLLIASDLGAALRELSFGACVHKHLPVPKSQVNIAGVSRLRRSPWLDRGQTISHGRILPRSMSRSAPSSEAVFRAQLPSVLQYPFHVPSRMGHTYGCKGPGRRIRSPRPWKPSWQTLRPASSFANSSFRATSQSSQCQSNPYRTPAMKVSPAPMVLQAVSVAVAKCDRLGVGFTQRRLLRAALAGGESPAF